MCRRNIILHFSVNFKEISFLYKEIAVVCQSMNNSGFSTQKYIKCQNFR